MGVVSNMVDFNLFKLSFLLTLFSSYGTNAGVSPANPTGHVSIFPPTCNRIECPSYKVIQTGNGFEIRRYDSAVWMSTSPIDDISFVSATRTGFLRLFDYIQGKNEFSEQIEMTAPVISQVQPSDGPFCTSAFVVSFYVPKKNQANPPPAKGLHVQKWGTTYVAVRQFGGFIADTDVGQEASYLYESLAGTVWSELIDISHEGDNTTLYTVAQYNSPFEFNDRVNEVWLSFYPNKVFRS